MTSTQLVLLGTGGGPTPKASRSAPGQAVLVDGHTYLIDAGNGIARQLLLAGIEAKSLDTVLLTHHHSDHNADLGTVLLLNWGANLDHPVDVLGPPPTTEMLRNFFEMQRVDIETRIADEGRPDLRQLVTSRDITHAGLVLEDSRVRITAALVNHPPFEVALAYRIDTEDRAIVISGDTAPCQALIDLAEGADILVHEVLYEPALDWIVSRSSGRNLRQHLVNSHTSVNDVGKIAEAAAVPTLVLSHFVPADARIAEEVWTAAASAGFSGTVIAGRDLMVL
jgi:ribonuclease BN (tRNA processing enzyme)